MYWGVCSGAGASAHAVVCRCLLMSPGDLAMLRGWSNATQADRRLLLHEYAAMICLFMAADQAHQILAQDPSARGLLYLQEGRDLEPGDSPSPAYAKLAMAVATAKQRPSD